MSIYILLCFQPAYPGYGTNDGWPAELKGGFRIQKAQKLYWEDGFSFDFTSPKIIDRRIHLASYLTTRLGSAMGSNATGHMRNRMHSFIVELHTR